MLPKIWNHSNELAEQLKQFKVRDPASADAEDDSESDGFIEESFSDEVNLMKVCFGLCFRLLAALFSWTAFSHDANKDTLIRKSNARSNKLKIDPKRMMFSFIFRSAKGSGQQAD